MDELEKARQEAMKEAGEVPEEEFENHLIDGKQVQVTKRKRKPKKSVSVGNTPNTPKIAAVEQLEEESRKVEAQIPKPAPKEPIKKQAGAMTNAISEAIRSGEKIPVKIVRFKDYVKIGRAQEDIYNPTSMAFQGITGYLLYNFLIFEDILQGDVVIIPIAHCKEIHI